MRMVLAFVAGLIAMAAAGSFWMHRNANPRVDTDGGIITQRESVGVGEVVTGIRALDRLVVFQTYLAGSH